MIAWFFDTISAVLVLALLWPVSVAADTLASSVYVRTDGDHTTVVSPHARLSKQLFDNTTVDVAYTADIWTSASIDIRASASLPVTEQRDELNFGLTHELGDLDLTVGYRYSVEHDYLSHGVNAGAAYAFADNNATLALNGYALFDTVGRAGFPAFSEPLRTVGGRLSFTQIFDPLMFGQLTYELTHVDGYQASPYRKVGFGGTGFGCRNAAICLDEHEPDWRNRHAAALLVRRALSDQFSLGVTYRFIVDDWGLTSHTGAAQLAFLIDTMSTLTLRYRAYWQSGVNFYAKIYPINYPQAGFTTRDREQSPMHDQRIALDWEQRVHLDTRLDLAVTASAAGSLYDYSQFVGLTHVWALELTLAIALVR